MYALTGLNIQFLALFGYVVGQVFIRLLRYYGTNSAGRIVKILCKTKVLGGTATLPPLSNSLPKGAIGQYIENHPSPQPSPIVEGVSNNLNHEDQSGVPHDIACHPKLVSGSHKMLKQVQDEMFSFPKRTYSLYKQAAFTLAEVLITLGIIGVVAAMTMPVLIQNYQKKQTAVKLKATYSLLAQAVQLSEADNGELEYWDFSLNSQDFFDKYFSKYLTFINTKVNDDNIDYYWLNGEKITGNFKEVVNTSYIGILNNGAKLFYHTAGELYTFTIIVDINGEARPNKVGRDVFHFSLSAKDGLRPWGYNNINYSNDGGQDASSNFGTNLDRDILTGNGLYACNKASRGRWCAALIMADGWEIKSDYPW